MSHRVKSPAFPPGMKLPFTDSLGQEEKNLWIGHKNFQFSNEVWSGSALGLRFHLELKSSPTPLHHLHGSDLLNPTHRSTFLPSFIDQINGRCCLSTRCSNRQRHRVSFPQLPFPVFLGKSHFIPLFLSWNMDVMIGWKMVFLEMGIWGFYF